mmetsp:Transcript_19232/g.66025  ORF Transcript_19232/g.66025 Transcript_19232/m.66025 type:complete len:262 (-) Transcript_19232:613-1398(-)
MANSRTRSGYALTEPLRTRFMTRGSLNASIFSNAIFSSPRHAASSSSSVQTWSSIKSTSPVAPALFLDRSSFAQSFRASSDALRALSRATSRSPVTLASARRVWARSSFRAATVVARSASAAARSASAAARAASATSVAARAARAAARSASVAARSASTASAQSRRPQSKVATSASSSRKSGETVLERFSLGVTPEAPGVRAETRFFVGGGGTRAPRASAAKLEMPLNGGSLPAKRSAAAWRSKGSEKTRYSQRHSRTNSS